MLLKHYATIKCHFDERDILLENSLGMNQSVELSVTEKCNEVEVHVLLGCEC